MYYLVKIFCIIYQKIQSFAGLFHIVFLHLLYLFMINLGNTLLDNDRVQAILANIGKIIKPTPVIDRDIEVDVAPMITIESTEAKIMFRVL